MADDRRAEESEQAPNADDKNISVTRVTSVERNDTSKRVIALHPAFCETEGQIVFDCPTAYPLEHVRILLHSTDWLDRGVHQAQCGRVVGGPCS